MVSVLRFTAICLAALALASGAHALENAELVTADAAQAPRRHAPPATEEARNDSGMQAICREVLVDTDEGYGVSSRESRVVCDELR